MLCWAVDVTRGTIGIGHFFRGTVPNVIFLFIVYFSTVSFVVVCLAIARGVQFFHRAALFFSRRLGPPSHAGNG